MPPMTPGINGPVSFTSGNGSNVSLSMFSNQVAMHARRETTSSLDNTSKSWLLVSVLESAVSVSVLPHWKAEECQDGAVKWVSHFLCFSPSMSKSGGTVVRAPSCRYTRGGVPMIYSPDSARRTPGAAAAYDGAKEVGLQTSHLAMDGRSAVAAGCACCLIGLGYSWKLAQVPKSRETQLPTPYWPSHFGKGYWLVAQSNEGGCGVKKTVWRALCRPQGMG